MSVGQALAILTLLPAGLCELYVLVQLWPGIFSSLIILHLALVCWITYKIIYPGVGDA